MLKFKNGEITPTINFLSQLPLKNKSSRARTVLVKKLTEKNEEYTKFQVEIIEKYGERDEKEQLVEIAPGSFKIQKEYVSEANEILQELLEEEVYINVEEYRPNIKFLVTALNKLDMELAGQDALLYDNLLDKLEKESEGE
ncbi:DUF1617 family protein [Lactococcus garvieae]|uniref:Phage protein n=1 Tax=Lactococcus garvieae DCC43 TaxID=1231377 RepID=K2PJP1_9LACT|nr:DUF1617 family protein [Lactococcus garvieae]EKF50444.1 hypothetical protein C426_2224 [Lactococcus garvieae DCC43]